MPTLRQTCNKKFGNEFLYKIFNLLNQYMFKINMFFSEAGSTILKFSLENVKILLLVNLKKLLILLD